MKKTGCNTKPSVQYVVVIMCNDPTLKLTAENGKRDVTVQGHIYSQTCRRHWTQTTHAGRILETIPFSPRLESLETSTEIEVTKKTIK